MTIRETKFLATNYDRHGKAIHKMIPVQIESDGKYHYIEFGYNQALLAEVKSFRGAKWLGYDETMPRKAWRIDDCRRNNFNLEYLEGKNPFTRYTTPLTNLNLPTHKFMTTLGKEVPIYGHQIDMARHMILRRQCNISGEMGVGKTLSAFLAIEHVRPQGVWFIAPKSALASVQLESWVWGITYPITFMTYDELKKRLQTWVPGTPPPQMVIMDEASKVKTPSSQRSQAAYYLAESMRDYWNDSAFIILMSGSPAPKSPLDWYWQCEISCPGYIKEGDIHKFQQRLAVMQRVEDVSMKSFMKLKAWRDGDKTKCNICGEDCLHQIHTNSIIKNYHAFVEMPNEIDKLYRRMQGLVYVKFKKDCLDLPDKIYRTIQLKPSLDLLRAARMVQASAKNVISSLTLMRELSDGFQYRDVTTAVDTCTVCDGNRTIYSQTEKNEEGGPLLQTCPLCEGTGSKNKVTREIVEVESPKLNAISELLEENDEIGRLVLYAGFTASIDRVCQHVNKLHWKFIRVDGRGWYNNIDPSWDAQACLKAFQDRKRDDKIAFIGHPGSAGMGLTLTAASMIVYVSNDFNGESRIQSEDRIHRAGMDVNRGATIVDLLLLPSDKKVLDNLKRKRDLQSMSLGELQTAMDQASYT